MFSFMAALRTLVLPFGTITGTRIVLDGVNGRISVFDSSDAEVIREDSTTGTISVGSQTTGARIVLEGANAALRAFNASNVEGITLDAVAGRVSVQSSSGSRVRLDADRLVGSVHQSVLDLTPPSYAGTNWFPGQILSTYVGTPQPGILEIVSPRESEASNGALISLVGGYVGHDQSQIQMYAHDYYFVTDLINIAESTSGAGSKILIDGNIVITRVATDTQTATSVVTSGTTEIEAQTVTANLLAGKTYKIVSDAPYIHSVATDCVLLRIREDSLTGTQLQGYRAPVPGIAAAVGHHIEVEYVAAASGSKTFSLTMARAAGTGTITRTSGATQPANFIVDRV